MRDDLDLEHAIAESVDRSIPFIDAHHHIWDLSRWPYRWIRDEVKPDGSIAPVTDATAVLGEYKILRQTWTMERLQRDFYGSNVIGTVQPIGAIGRICRDVPAEQATDVSVTIGEVTVNPGDYVLADSSAVVFIAAAEIALVTGHGGEMVIPGMCSTHACAMLPGS